MEAVVAVQVHRLDAAHRANRVERPVRHAQRIAAQGVAILPLHGDGGAREGRGHGLVDRGEGRLAVGTLLELNDDDDRGVSVLAAGLRARAALPVFRCQSRVGVDRRRGRGTRRGLGRVAARVGLLRGRRRGGGRAARDRERARANTCHKNGWILHGRLSPTFDADTRRHRDVSLLPTYRSGTPAYYCRTRSLLDQTPRAQTPQLLPAHLHNRRHVAGLTRTMNTDEQALA